MTTIVTNDTSTQVTRVVGALFGVAPGSYYLNLLVGLGSDVGATTNTLIANNFPTLSKQDLANKVVANLGITGDLATTAATYLVSKMTTAGAGHWGEAILAAVNGYATLENDPTSVYTAQAATFNTTTTNALSYSQVAANSSRDLTVLATAYTATVAPTVQSVTLTTGIDTGSAFTAGSANDTFGATINLADSTKSTLNAGDSLVGGAGTDTLSVIASGTAAAATINVTGFFLNGVENLTVQNSDSVATDTLTFDLANSTGLTGATVQASTANVTLNNVKNLVSLTENSNNGQTVTLGYATTVVAGTADVQNVTLNNVNTTTSGAIVANGIETVAVTTTGAASGSATTTTTLTGDSINKVTVTGDQAVNLTTTFTTTGTTVGTFDASKETAAVTATLTAGANAKLSVTGGSANDTFTINTLSANVTVDGGAGTADTLKTSQTTITATDISNVKNVEALNLTAVSDTTDLTGNSAITTVTYSNASGQGASTLTGVASGETVAISSVGGTSLGVTVTGAATATNDVLNVNLGTTGTSGSTGGSFGTLTATGVETLNFTSVGKTADTGTNTVTVAGNSVTTVSVNGAEKFKLTQSGGSITKFDASLATAAQDTTAITFSSAGASITGGAANDTLVGGAGNDSIVSSGGNDSLVGAAGNDTIIGGDGNDTITGGAGADTLTGGKGTNTYVYTAQTESTTAVYDTIADFKSGTDKITGTGATKFLGNFSSVGAGTAALSGAAGEAFFSTTDNTLYVNLNADQTLTAANDMAIKLTGVTSLAAADLGLGSQGSGNSITLTAANATLDTATNTNASAKTTALDDTISTQAQYLGLTTGTVDGGAGVDKLVITDGGTVNVTRITNVETLDLTSTTVANTVSNVGTSFTTALLGAKGDSITMTATASVSVTGGAGDDQITLTDATTTATIVGGAGNDTVTVGTLAGTSALSITDASGTADVLKVASGKTADFSAATISGFETLLGVNGAAETVTLTSAQFSGFSTFNLGATASSDGADKITLSGAGLYDLTGKTATTLNDWTLGTAGSTLKGNVAQLQQDITGTGVGGGDTLNIANDANATVTAAGGTFTVTKFDTIVYSGNSDKTLSVESNNIYKSTDGSTVNTGAQTITGSGTSNLTLSSNADYFLTAAAVTGFDLITLANGGGGNKNLVVDAADVAGSVSLATGAGTDANLKIQDATASLTSLTVGAGFDSIVFDNAGTASGSLTISQLALGTNVASITSGGTTSTLTVNASAATSAVNMSAVTGALTNISTVTINDGSGNNTITVTSGAGATGDANRAKVTVALTTGNDTVVIDDDAQGTTALGNAVAAGATVTGFTAGSGANGDTLTLKIGATAASQWNAPITAAGTAETFGTKNTVVAIASSLGTLSDFTAVGDGGAVENLLANAIGTSSTNTAEYWAIVYGAGASAGKAAVYHVYDSANNADSTATTITGVSLVAVLTGVTADSLVQGNFM